MLRNLTKTLFIFVYLFTVSCGEETHKPNTPSSSMSLVFSDALPVQWWLNDCDTYNESEICGLHQACWCQPWNCGDLMPIQFTGVPGVDYRLTITDADEILESEIEIPEVASGRFELDIDLSEYCDNKVRLLILEAGSSSSGYFSTTSSSHAGWNNIIDSVPQFRIGSFDLPVKSTKSPILSTTINNGDDLDITVTSLVTGHTWNYKLTLMQSYGSDTQVIDFGNINTSTDGDLNDTITATSNFDQLLLEINPVAYAGSSGSVSASASNIRILRTGGTPIVDNATFDGSTLSPWTNQGASGTDWVHGTTVDATQSAIVSNSSPGAFSKNLRESFAYEISAGTDVQVTADFDDVLGTSDLEVGFSDDGSTGWEWFLLTSGVAGGGVLTNDANYMAFRQTRTNGIGNTRLRLNDITAMTADGIDILGSEILPIPTSGWTEIGGGYGRNSSSYAVSIDLPGTGFFVEFFDNSTSSQARRSVAIPASSVRYNLQLQALTDEVGVDIDWTIEFRKADATVVQTITGSITDELSNEFTGITTLDEAITNIVFYAENNGAAQNIELEVESFSMGSAEALAKTDCIDLKESHSCVNAIDYSNQRDFAAIDYSDSSPNPSFRILIPSRFVHERYPETDEAMELISSVVVTSSEIKTQRLLEVIHAPYYFHRKIQLVLKHHRVEIDGVRWQKEEKYELGEGRRDWPLKSATCFLTKTNSVVRNVL